MASSSSSSSSTTAWVYDVFLSFRGETRKSFTDHLYEDLRQAGINTFRDDEEMRKGENISDELLKAIEGSKISIVVFSKTYAQSRWCLDELVKILECKKNLQQMVLPIFYNVDPSEVRKQTGEFGKALAQHRQRFDDQKVDEWKVALTTVADLSGWDLQTMTNGYESKFIKKITEEVMREVNRTYINVAKYPVGIESRVSDILHLLQTQKHNDIKMFGIFGMGGVGKTTLAKAIYNLSFQKFESCCFIANIRSQASDGYNGLVRLQEKLLCKTLNGKKLEIDNVDEGISLIKERLRSKSVLIVLDDIDDTRQLESLAGQRNWFGSGSTIIITTRDVQLLSDLEAHEKYMVETLSPCESLQLLSSHAFGVPIPLEEYIDLSERIASYTGGLPLALTIIGSHLRGKSVQEWSDDAKKLRGIPHDDVQKILKISYDSLDDDTRNIFLDIVCFFIGHDKNDTSMILEACGFYAKSGIRILIERCLLATSGDGKFGSLEMHDLVRDMGREIVRKESLREPGKQSRLIDPKDVFDVLHGNKGTKAIEGMIVNSNMLKNVPLNTQIFKKMVKLRILILNGTCLSGSFKYLSNELRLLRLHNCQLKCIPSNFRCEKLVVLDMEGSNIKEFQCNMQYFRCLKILKFNLCEQLKKTPNFTGAHTLEKVSFWWCSKLVKVHPSIGSLEKLVELDMEGCNIKEFQCSMQHFRCLKILKFVDCKQLKKTPNFTGAHTLQKVSFNWCSNLVKVHPSIGSLERLVELDMKGCNIKEFQCSMQHFRCLKILKFDYCKQLKKTPNFTGAHTLQKLSFMGCSNLVKVHPSIGSLERLVELDMEGCNIKEFQCSMQHFRCLKILKFDNCKQLKKTPNFTGAHTLQKVSFMLCSNLVKVHSSIGSLETLVKLNFYHCKKLEVLPSSICKLKSLEVLDINHCEKLRELPIDLGKLEQLRELLANETDISHIPFSLGCLRNLKKLVVHKAIEKSRDGVAFFPPSVANSCSFEVIENLTSLEYLHLSGRSCYLQSLPFHLCHLSNLKVLYLKDFQNLRVLVDLPPSLVKLSTKNCVSLEKIVTISNLKLEELELENCESLVELPNMESLSSLECLNIRNCNALSIPDNYLHEEDFPIALRSLSSSLNEIDLMGSYYLQSLLLSLCHQYSNLETLALDNLQNLRSLPQLPPNLRVLSAKNCVSLENIADLSNLKRLWKLDIQNCKSLVELSGLESLKYLDRLGIANCSSLRIPSIEKWFKVHPIHDSVYIHVGVVGRGRIYCRIGLFEIVVNVIDPSEIDYADDGRNRIDLSVRSKSSGANWILMEPKRKQKQWGLFQDNLFDVPKTMMGEELEVYVEVHDWQKIFCVAEIHRNREGEVRFFPSTRGCIPSYNKEDGERKRKGRWRIWR